MKKIILIVMFFVLINPILVKYCFAEVKTYIFNDTKYVLASEYDDLYNTYQDIVETYLNAVNLANIWKEKYEILFNNYSSLLEDYKIALNNLNKAVELLSDFPNPPKYNPLLSFKANVFIAYTNNGFTSNLNLSWTPLHLGIMKIGLSSIIGYQTNKFNYGGGLILILE